MGHPEFLGEGQVLTRRVGHLSMQKIKGGSSLWLHESCGLTGFEWQKGYGAFTIGVSQVEATAKYIAGQTEHHRKRDFQAEFLAILKQHGIEYDLRFVWG